MNPSFVRLPFLTWDSLDLVDILQVSEMCEVIVSIKTFLQLLFLLDFPLILSNRWNTKFGYCQCVVCL